MSDQFNNDFFNTDFHSQNTTNADSGTGAGSTAKTEHKKLSKGAVIFIILAVVCAFAGLSPFFLHKHISVTKKISVHSNIIKEFDDISDIKNLKKSMSKVKIAGKSTAYISKIYIEGVIQTKNKTYDQKRLLALLKELEDDENNKAIILYVNSPGGTVFDSDNVYLELEKYKSKGKLVHAYFAQMAASGAYYIGCSATNISANRNSFVGSIGVICGQFMDATELLAKIGIKSKTVTSGKNKNMGNFNEPLSDEHIAIMQSIADEAYNQFTGIVAKNRKMKIDEVLKIADGRIYSARQALENGLIDNICSYEAAETMLKKDLNNPEIEVHDEKFEEKPSVYDMLTGAKTFIKCLSVFLQTGSINQALTQADAGLSLPAYYYPM